jgi:PPM family protein phosphatase
MGTTATAAGVLDGAAFVAQVGDSRGYLARDGVVTQLTRDQSLVQRLVDAGALTEEEAESSGHASVILQAVGVQPEVEVELVRQPLLPGDWLVLCSDGLHRVVPGEEIGRILTHGDGPGPACDELVRLANERGGPDNITVVAAHMTAAGPAPPGPPPPEPAGDGPP